MKTESVTIMAKCINYGLSPSYSYKKFKCRCLVCSEWKKEASKTNDPIKSKERYKIWINKNPEKRIKYAKTYSDKKVIPCRYCKTNIPLTERDHGVVFCSDECRIEQRNEDSKKSRNKKHILFRELKTSIGCLICKYNTFGGSLDFHHMDPTIKERRIEGKHFFSKESKMTDELVKCVLLCKNCHYEVHDSYRNNKEDYWTLMNSLNSIMANVIIGKR